MDPNYVYLYVKAGVHPWRLKKTCRGGAFHVKMKGIPGTVLFFLSGLV
jgi:hypothetical protein